MSDAYKSVLDFLRSDYGINFTPERYLSLERKIDHRLFQLNITDPKVYMECLKFDGKECQRLVDLLTVNVSRFFRNSLIFELLSARVLPRLLQRKANQNDWALRVWSAGCANGEEPYSVAILLTELLRSDFHRTDVQIFASDISRGALSRAKQGVYRFDQIKNVRMKFADQYFDVKDDHYIVKRRIREMVCFIQYDMNDTRTYVPPETVYGGFDLVLCRNLLIYYLPESQDLILKKLYRSLKPGGVLILGEAEYLSGPFKDKFDTALKDFGIYQKHSYAGS